MNKVLDETKKKIEKGRAEIAADYKARSAELSKAGEVGKGRLQARIDTTKAELHKAQEQVTAQIEATRREADEKLAALKEHGPKAREERDS